MKIAGNEIKPGAVIEHDGSLWVAVKTQAVKPGKGGAYNQVELKNLFDGRKLNERFLVKIDAWLFFSRLDLGDGQHSNAFALVRRKIPAEKRAESGSKPSF